MSIDIEASLVDQQLNGLIEQNKNFFIGIDADRSKSRAFVLLCISKFMGCSIDEAFDLLTDGSRDSSIDGISIGDVDDDEFLVTIFQAKYKKNLNANSNFPASAISLLESTIKVLFDPYSSIECNDKLKPKVEEIRSLVKSGYIPRVKVVLCNNGLIWNEDGQKNIDRITGGFPDSVSFTHFNHQSIIGLMRKTKHIDCSLQLSGKIIVEDHVYKRVLIGKIHVGELLKLYREHRDGILEKNIRRYLGLNENRVNSEIRKTLLGNDAPQFYFFNNGLTFICEKFAYNAMQQENHVVKLQSAQLINGGQTYRTIFESLDSVESLPNSYLLVRIYQVDESEEDFINKITYATNSQNPVDLRDLHSNDIIQKNLEMGFKELGVVYRRQRDNTQSSSGSISSTLVAEAVLSVLRQRPHQAKFFRREFFRKFYNDIFNDLTAPQALLACEIYRYVESRKRSWADISDAPQYIPYASHYLAMIMGSIFLSKHNCAVEQIDFKNINDLLSHLKNERDDLYKEAQAQVESALKELYGGKKSLQQLAATFRRSDLLDYLSIDRF